MSGNVRIAKIKYKRWELRKAILKIIILGLLSGGGTPLRPTLPLMIGSIIKYLKEEMNIDAEEKKVRRVLVSLEKKEILHLEQRGDIVSVSLIEENNPIVVKHSIKLLLDFKKKEKKWNGKWFFVFFDVPEIQRKKRNYLRDFLTKLGFYRYQKSVYIFPYECEREVKLIKKIVEGGKYMKYIVAEKIEDEEEAKSFFHLNQITDDRRQFSNSVEIFESRLK